MSSPKSHKDLLEAVERSNNKSAIEVIMKHADRFLLSNIMSESEYKKIKAACEKRLEKFGKVPV